MAAFLTGFQVRKWKEFIFLRLFIADDTLKSSSRANLSQNKSPTIYFIHATQKFVIFRESGQRGKRIEIQMLIVKHATAKNKQILGSKTILIFIIWCLAFRHFSRHVIYLFVVGQFQILARARPKLRRDFWPDCISGKKNIKVVTQKQKRLT